MLLVAIVSATPRSPFFALLPRDYEPTGPFRWLADLLGLQYLNDPALMFVGLLATVSAAVTFILVLREAWNGRLSMRTVMTLAIVYQVVVVMLPLLFSRDVYSYAYYGRIVSTYGDNPYTSTPQDYPLNSLWQLTWPGWRGTPSVYGPLFTWISAVITDSAKSLTSLINGFQLLAAAAAIGTLVIVRRLVQQVKPDRALFAVAVIGLNPVVVFHVVGGGHNDILVAFFVAAATALLFARRELLSAVMLGLGMSVKASAAVPLLLMLVAVGARAAPERRARVVAKYSLVSVGIWLVLAFPFLQSANPTLGLLEVAGHDSGKAPGQLIVSLVSWIGGTLGAPFDTTSGIAAKVILLGLAIAAVWLIARRIWLEPNSRTPLAQVSAWGGSLLLVLLLSPVLGAWYLAWILPLAWAMPRAGRRALVMLSASFVVTELMTESSRLPEFLANVRFPFGHPVAVAVAVWVAIEFIRRMKAKIPFDAESPWPVFGDRFEAGGLGVRGRARERDAAQRPEPGLAPERAPGVGALSPLSALRKR